MKTVERDGLVVLLAIASGSADGWSYFGLGHAFVANMTGNTVLLGMSVFHPTGDATHQLTALCGYVAGVVAGTLIARRVPEGALWAKSVSWTLFLEAVLLLASAVAWIATTHHPGPRVVIALLACVATAVGLQSAAMFQLRVPGVVTTYITGTWTTLANGLTRLAGREPRILRSKTAFEERFALQVAVLAFYFLSAVLTGWAFRSLSGIVGCISAVSVLLAAGYGALRD